jgi:uncharacterized protein YndB with AHSA1/START domain
MTLRLRVRIQAPPERVWRYLEDPELMKLWNPKIKNVAAVSWGQRGRGFRYRLTYVLGGTASEVSAEIEEYQPAVKLAIRLTGGRMPPAGFAQEVYELTREGGGTALTQTIQLHNAGINLFVRLLIAFVHRFGRPTGTPYLTQLKHLAEGAP